MTVYGFTLFDTDIGRCGIAWGACGVAGVQLPERSDHETRTRLLRKCPDACRSFAAAGCAAGDQRHRRAAAGRSDRPLQGRARPDPRAGLRAPRLRRRANDPARATLTYGEIATRLGDRGLARDVGQALGRNPFPIVVPCHRVLAAGGKAGGFSANGGLTTKLRMLTIERARTSDAPTLFDGDNTFGLALEPRRRRAR